MTRPLEGTTVLALEHVIAAPLATRQLADLGARVIKIERPGGAGTPGGPARGGDQARGYDRRVRGLSSHFVWVNRGKESLTLDLKHPAAAGVIERLLERADVLVQNLAPGAAARLGLDFEALHPRFPRLVVCGISGYGDDPERPGPMRERKAYDLLIQAEAGFLSVTGSPEAPAKAGIAIADIAAGTLAHARILAALLQRVRTGRGARIDVSMLEALAEWMGFPMLYAYDGAEPPPRSGAAHATIEPYGPFAAGDGGTVIFGLQNEREWRVFCERVLERPALADDARFAGNPARVQHRAALQAEIGAVFATLTTPQLLARLEGAGIGTGRLNDMAALWAHPQLHARGLFMPVASEAGALTMLAPPALPQDPALAAEAGAVAIPSVGEHTDALLAELGYGSGEIAALRAAGAV